MTDVKITRHDNGTVTIEGELPHENLEKHRASALTALGRDVALPGFRKGHAPEDVLAKHVGEHALLAEMAERALSEHYPAVLIEHKIDAIGRPEVSITKLALGNPLGFKLTTAVMPTVALPDYKTIASETAKKHEVKDVEVSDPEVEQFIQNILKERAQKNATKESQLTATGAELTDTVAQTLGDFKDVADLKAKVKEGMALDKKRTLIEKRRLAILEALAAKSPFVIPDILIEAELNKIMAQFMHDLERMGLDSKEYFTRIGKDEAAMRKELRSDAEKRARIQLILNEIAVAEKIAPTKEEIEKEVDHVLSHHEPHEGHDEASERERATIYVATILTNEKVLNFLENL